MPYSIIDKGRVLTLDKGHMPQFSFGLDANKSSSPDVGDTHYATNTLKTYYCYVAGLWTLISSPVAERYSNHLGAVDNFTAAAAAGLNFAYATDAANHKMTMTSGITNTGSVYWASKKTWALNALTNPIICNFILQDIVVGANANYSGSKIGLASDFTQALPWGAAIFSMSPAGVWQTYTIDDAGGQSFTTINPQIANNDICTIIAVASYVFYLVNGALVATHKLNLPGATALKVGSGITADVVNWTVARSWSVDYFDITVLK